MVLIILNTIVDDNESNKVFETAKVFCDIYLPR